MPYPLTTRTGIAQVDRVIEAVVGADRSSLRSLIRYQIIPCPVPVTFLTGYSGEPS